MDSIYIFINVKIIPKCVKFFWLVNPPLLFGLKRLARDKFVCCDLFCSGLEPVHEDSAKSLIFYLNLIISQQNLWNEILFILKLWLFCATTLDSALEVINYNLIIFFFEKKLQGLLQMQQLQGLLGKKTGRTESKRSQHFSDHLHLWTQPSMAYSEKCARWLNKSTGNEERWSFFKELTFHPHSKTNKLKGRG